MNTRLKEKNVKADEIVRTAADWYTHLRSENLTHQDHERFVQWLAADPAHRNEYAALELIWSSLEHIDNTAAIEETVDQSRWGRWTQSLIDRVREPAMITVPAAVLAIVMMTALIFSSGDEINKYQTVRGEQTTVNLEDGSTVILNSDTELSVSLSKALREIELIKGQAFFTVAHDASRPFLVKAGNGVVRAIGTAFDVQKMDKLITVTVLEGRVEVLQLFNSKDIQINRREEIQASEQVSYAEVGTLSSVQVVDSDSATSWRTGMLDFNNQPLSEVVEKMNLYSEKQIVLLDSDVKRLRISGVFKIGDSDGLLRALERRFHINATDISDNKILVLKSDSSG